MLEGVQPDARDCERRSDLEELLPLCRSLSGLHEYLEGGVGFAQNDRRNLGGFELTSTQQLPGPRTDDPDRGEPVAAFEDRGALQRRERSATRGCVGSFAADDRAAGRDP